MAVMHDLQLAQDLLAHGRLRVDKDDLPNTTKHSEPRASDAAGRHGLRFTFLAMIVSVGTCSTFFTLPPLPCPSSFRSLRSSSRKSYLTSAFISRLASVFDSVVWYVMRFIFAAVFALAGADVGPGATASSPSPTAAPAPAASAAGASAGTLGLRFMGGGRFLPLPPAGLVAGARRVGTGASVSGGSGCGVTSSWSALKLRLERMRLIVSRAQTLRGGKSGPGYGVDGVAVALRCLAATGNAMGGKNGEE